MSNVIIAINIWTVFVARNSERVIDLMKDELQTLDRKKSKGCILHQKSKRDKIIYFTKRMR